MGYRTLEITIQYAEDLSKVNFISKMDVYVVASISGGDEDSKQKTKTTVNHEDDSNPMWSFPMKFRVEEAALLQNRLILDLKIKCERALGDRLIGEVHVPIKDLLHNFQAKAQSFVSYQVKKPGGKPKGKLTFSYQFREKKSEETATFAVPAPVKEMHGEYMIAPSTPRLYPVVDSSPLYQPISIGGYQSISPEIAAAAVVEETTAGHKVVEATSLYPPIPPPLRYLPAGGLELERHAPPPQPCCVYPPPPVMQLAPDWWILDWRYDTRCSGF